MATTGDLPYEELETKLAAELTKRTRRPLDAELWKLLNRTNTAAWNARRLDTAAASTRATTARGSGGCSRKVVPLDLDHAFEVVDHCDQLLIERGDAHHAQPRTSWREVLLAAAAGAV